MSTWFLFCFWSDFNIKTKLIASIENESQTQTKKKLKIHFERVKECQSLVLDIDSWCALAFCWWFWLFENFICSFSCSAMMRWWYIRYVFIFDMWSACVCLSLSLSLCRCVCVCTTHCVGVHNPVDLFKYGILHFGFPAFTWTI